MFYKEQRQTKTCHFISGGISIIIMEKVHFLVTEQKDRHDRHLQMPIVRSTLTGKLFLQGH